MTLVWVSRKHRTAVLDHALKIATLETEVTRLQHIIEGHFTTTELVNSALTQRLAGHAPLAKRGLVGRVNRLEAAATAKCPKCQQPLPDKHAKETG